GALELHSIAQMLVHSELYAVVPGVCCGSMKLDGAPVGVEPRVVAGPVLPAVREDLRNSGVAVQDLHEVDAPGTGVTERQAHLPRQLALQREVIVQDVRLPRMVVDKPQSLANHARRVVERNSKRRRRTNGTKR